MIKAAIVGANGYTGFELMRLLASHPKAEVISAVSRSLTGTEIKELYPSLAFTYADMKFSELNFDELKKADVCFTALPHAASAEIAGKLADRGVRVIDLSADFRYDSVSLYEDTYKVKHPRPELNKEAVYGLPELFREKIKSARIVGNPGCYTTASILPLYPLLKEKAISVEGIIIDAKSGVTGAGRKADAEYNLSETAGNLKAYGVFTHRHRTEIEEKIGAPAIFTPHLLPVGRGILCTVYCTLNCGADRVEKIYGDYYEKEKFVKVTDTLPEIKWVRGSNYCAIGYKEHAGRLIIVSVIDNLIKGASGQAIQNMNVMFGIKEDEGLTALPLYL